MIRKTLLPLCLFTVVSLCLPSSAAAQAKSGDNEILTFGNVISILSTDFTSTTGQFTFNIGRFVSDHTQIGGGPTISISSTTTPASTTASVVGGRLVTTTIPSSTTVDASVGANGFLRQYFGSTKVQPYVGAEAFFQNFEDSESLFLNGIVGVKNYFSERAALDFKGAFGFNAKHAAEIQILQFSVGITVLF